MPFIVLHSLSSPPEAPRDFVRDFAYVDDLMCRPEDDPAHRYLAYATSRMRDALQHMPPEFVLPVDHVLLLAQSPTLIERNAELSETARFKGYLSGIILMHIIARSQHAETRGSASLLDAWRMVGEGLRARRLRGGSISNLQQHVWYPYKAIAHLWAAAITLWDAGRDWNAATETGLRDFLMIAEAFRREGEAFVPVGAHARILDSETIWKVPPEVGGTWPRFDLPPYEDPDAWDLRKGVKSRN